MDTDTLEQPTMALAVQAPSLPAGILVTDPDPIKRMSTNTMHLCISKRTFGNSKKASLAGARFVADGDTESKEPDVTLLSLSKCILASPELTELNKHDGETSRLLRKRAFPSMFRAGIFLISIAEVEDVNTWLKEERQPQRELLVQKAVAMYDQRCRETSERLGMMHSPTDYPSVETFAGKFGFEFQWISWDTPNRLKAVSMAVFEQEKLKARGFLASVAEEGRQAMRAILLKLVTNLTTALKPGDDGKKRRLGKGSIEHVQDFLSAFDARNVTGDEELAELVRTSRAVMTGVDRAMLKDENIRTRVGQDLDGVMAALQVMTEGDREVTFDDDDI